MSSKEEMSVNGPRDGRGGHNQKDFRLTACPA